MCLADIFLRTDVVLNGCIHTDTTSEGHLKTLNIDITFNQPRGSLT